MTGQWETLYRAALGVAKPTQISQRIETGGVGAAVLSAGGNLYTGVCIDTSCSLGMCAERNALSTMFTAGEYAVRKVCAVFADGRVVPPCGACREFMMQLGADAPEIEVLLDNTGRTAKLAALLPEQPY